MKWWSSFVIMSRHIAITTFNTCIWHAFLIQWSCIVSWSFTALQSQLHHGNTQSSPSEGVESRSWTLSARVCPCVRARVCGLPGFDRLSGRSLLWSPFYSTCSSISASPPQPPSARARGPYNLVCERFSHCPASPSPELSGWPPHSSTLVLSPHWEIIDIAIFNMGFMLRGHYQ